MKTNVENMAVEKDNLFRELAPLSYFRFLVVVFFSGNITVAKNIASLSPASKYARRPRFAP